MNDISAILEKIDAEAQAYSTELLSRAEKKADAVKADYRAQAEKESAAALAKAKADAEAVLQRADSQSGIARRNALLSARRSVMDAAFEKAAAQLAALDEKSRVALYAKLAAQNISADAELVLSAADQKAVGAAVLEQAKKLIAETGKTYTLTAAAAPGDFVGGVMLRQGRVEVNCTYEVLLSAARESLEAEVVSALFGE